MARDGLLSCNPLPAFPPRTGPVEPTGSNPYPALNGHGSGQGTEAAVPGNEEQGQTEKRPLGVGRLMSLPAEITEEVGEMVTTKILRAYPSGPTAKLSGAEAVGAATELSSIQGRPILGDNVVIETSWERDAIEWVLEVIQRLNKEEQGRFCVLAWVIWQHQCRKLMEGKTQSPVECWQNALAMLESYCVVRQSVRVRVE
ncbi:hypothetical protein Salat_2781000 [Sesamum alatum]|uniref:Uncharacterized protein n=1 Tax=Sesamum alatum TaxID=300844 RepID=A0AAE1XLN8_9LAMI|nr:hypothetical protein Salat_2781000 [Sesamum alatum]